MIPGGVVCAVQGEDKSGKTSFALTLDSPVRHFELDLGGFRRAAWRVQEPINSGLIVSKSYILPHQATRHELRLTPSLKVVGAKDLWYRLLTDYVNVLDGTETTQGKAYNTVVIDSFTQFWALATMAFLEEKQERDPKRERLLEIEYGEPNQRVRSFIFAARQAGKNLVLLNQMRDKREDRMVQGEVKTVIVGRESDCWRHFTAVVDMVMQTTATQERDPQGKLVPVFTAQVVLCGLTWDLVGAKYGQLGEAPVWSNVEAELSILRGA